MNKDICMFNIQFINKIFFKESLKSSYSTKIRHFTHSNVHFIQWSV